MQQKLQQGLWMIDDTEMEHDTKRKKSVVEKTYAWWRLTRDEDPDAKTEREIQKTQIQGGASMSNLLSPE